jgi:glycosyltransferase involved in cell wall biosynthesis
LEKCSKMVLTNKMKLSIICLTYNHEKYIEKAIIGFLSQKTDFDYEIIIHDDNSQDSTQEIIKEYQKKFPDKIRSILQRNNQRSIGGNVYAIALNASSGEYIAYCEGDDYWVDEQKIQKQVEFLENNPNYSLTYSDCDIINGNGEFVKTFSPSKKDYSELELINGVSINTLTACYRRPEKIPDELGFSEYGDIFIWSLLGWQGKGKYLTTIKNSKYRVHAGGVHSKSTLGRKFDMIAITYSMIIKYYHRIGQHDVVINFRNKLIYEAIKFAIKSLNVKILFFGK